MSLGATLVASLLVTLARPSTWPMALATFLLIVLYQVEKAFHEHDEDGSGDDAAVDPGPGGSAPA